MVPPPFQKMVRCHYAGPSRVVQLPWAMHGATPSKDKLAELQRQIGWLMAVE